MKIEQERQLLHETIQKNSEFLKKVIEPKDHKIEPIVINQQLPTVIKEFKLSTDVRSKEFAKHKEEYDKKREERLRKEEEE